MDWTDSSLGVHRLYADSHRQLCSHGACRDASRLGDVLAAATARLSPAYWTVLVRAAVCREAARRVKVRLPLSLLEKVRRPGIAVALVCLHGRMQGRGSEKRNPSMGHFRNGTDVVARTEPEPAQSGAEHLEKEEAPQPRTTPTIAGAVVRFLRDRRRRLLDRDDAQDDFRRATRAARAERTVRRIGGHSERSVAIVHGSMPGAPGQ
jgi:hypothetical protein